VHVKELSSVQKVTCSQKRRIYIFWRPKRFIDHATFVNESARFLEEREAERKLQTPLPLGSSGLDECMWAGVTRSNGTVVELRLGTTGYSGSNPAEISLLTAVTHLDISQNQIGGTIPEDIYRLTNLQALYLYKNQLTGTSISSSAGNWFDMIQLHLSHNLLTGSIPSTLTPLDSAFRSFGTKWRLGVEAYCYARLKSSLLIFFGLLPLG
jgi:hypothetical protein